MRDEERKEKFHPSSFIFVFNSAQRICRALTHVKVSLNILAIVLFTAGPLVAQQIIDPPCTALSVSYPTYIVSGRVPIPVSVEVVGAKQVLGMERANRLSYQWTASHGSIMSGQGTSNILVVP